ncbi:MAG: hypothetical protein RL431_885 [Actinomycetota bacterium]|jgi:MraZ protein
MLEQSRNGADSGNPNRRRNQGKGERMLLGTYEPKLDDKGRIILPAKFRDEFADGVVLTRGQEHCVYVFSTAEFNQIHERIRQAPVNSKSARDYLRLFLSGASDEQLDKQHRVTIPANLRDYAGLDRELTVIGTGNRAEIWSTQAWNEYYADKEQAFSETEEEVIPGLF